MKTFISILFFLAIVLSMNAQITDNENKKKIKKELYEYELADLVNLSIEELVSIAERLGISVDELLALSSTSSAKIKLSYRDAPNIMSIITKEQILALGVRDIKDLLELIPGYDFGYDIDAIVGVYNRGNWAHEGKVLLMIDGMEMNETLYSTTQFGLHYSISNIERIEIIRGGGSAIYGGSAELGIINIITQKADAMPLVSAHSKLGVMTEGFGFYSEEFATAFQKNDCMFDVSANYKNGQLTNGVYANLWGDEINFSDKAMSSFYAFDINSKFNYKSLSVNVLADCYAPTSPDYISPQENKFESLLGNINYDWKVNEAFTIKPSFRYSRHRPWQVNAVEDDYIYNQTAQRFSPAMSAIFTVSNNFNIVSGVEYTYDYAKNNIEGEMYMNDKNTIVFNNIAFYLQSYLQTNFANFIVGGRLDRHNLGGIAFSPRLGIIKTLNDFNYKLLYSRTFKSPSISTYDINSDIKPEKTDIFEFQMGYKLGASSFVSANLFDITIHKPIVYYYDAITYESFYENFEKTGSRGFELEYIFMKRNTYISANYSYYHASGKNKVEKYNVYDEALNVISSQLLGAPQSKFVVYGYSTLFDNFTVTGSFVLKSPKYAYLTADYVEGTTPEEDYIIPLIGKMPRTYLLNAGIRFTNVWREGVHLGLNVFDILNQKPLIPQGYDGELQPYPSRGREFVFQVQFNVFRK